jgi:hypothetical protein
VVANCLEDKAVDQMREVVTRVLEVQAEQVVVARGTARSFLGSEDLGTGAGGSCAGERRLAVLGPSRRHLHWDCSFRVHDSTEEEAEQ